jgi:hypothetical protein
MENIIEKYGLEGYGLYWYINERITKELDPPKGIDCILMDNLDILARKNKIDKTKLMEMLDFFVEVGAFQKTIEGQYQNLKLLHRLDRYCKQKLKIKGAKINYETITTEELLRTLKEIYGCSKDGTTSAPSMSQDGSIYAPKGKERKINEMKENLPVSSNFRGSKAKSFATKENPENESPGSNEGGKKHSPLFKI